MSDAAQQPREYRLTTAEIIYHLPDHPALLQSWMIRKMVNDLRGRQPIFTRLLSSIAHIGLLSASHLRREDASMRFMMQEKQRKTGSYQLSGRSAASLAWGRLLKRSRKG